MRMEKDLRRHRSDRGAGIGIEFVGRGTLPLAIAGEHELSGIKAESDYAAARS